MRILGVITAALFVMSNAVSAQDIRDEALRIGEAEFFVNELVGIVFDKQADYRHLLGCESVLMEQKNEDGGINSACVTSNEVLWLSTSMTTGNRIGSAYVCPTNQSKSSVERLIELSFDSKSLPNGTVYHLGYTDGWRRDYVHRLAMLSINDQLLGCWDIGRR